MKLSRLIVLVLLFLVAVVPFCFTSSAQTPSPLPVAKFQGAVIGEIRTFSFGDDKTVAWRYDGTNLVKASLRELGWISCEGQSLDDVEFPELASLLKSPAPPNSTSSLWGSLDVKHDFSIPDLRGMFLRGYQPASPAPPNPAGGELDRQSPRPDITAQGSDKGQKDARGVGSFQGQQIEAHRHSLGEFNYAMDHSGGAIGGLENTPGKQGYTQGVVDANVGKETRPKNVHVMYCIWTGHVATNATVTPAGQAKKK